MHILMIKIFQGPDLQNVKVSLVLLWWLFDDLWRSIVEKAKVSMQTLMIIIFALC